MLISQYKAILFDYDDTLVNTIHSKWAQHKECAKTFYNLELTDDAFRKVWGNAFEKMIFELYEGKDDVASMIKNYHTLGDKYLKSTHEGAVELFTHLVSNGYTVGILSAMTRTVVAAEAHRLGLPVDQMIAIQGEEDTTVHKPDPKVFEPMLEKLALKGITNLETLYVGDAIRDLKAAQGAGLGFVGITNGLTSRVEFEAEKAPVIDTLMDLLTL